MSYSNRAFETAGETRGAASGWTLASLASFMELAGYRSRENVLVRSETFANASWTKTNATVSADSGGTPPGLAGVADAIVDDGTNGEHRISQLPAGVVDQPITVSVYAKRGSVDFISMQCDASGGSVWFDLLNGEIGQNTGVCTARMVSVGADWYRCIITNPAWANLDTVLIRAASADGSNTYAGTSTAAVYLHAAAATVAASPGEYLVTSTAALTERRGYDDFERLWSSSEESLLELPGTTTPAIYSDAIVIDGLDHDSFETGWSEVQAWEGELLDAEAGITDSFQEGWDDVEFGFYEYSGLFALKLTAGLDDSFESGWPSDNFLATLSALDLVAAAYGEASPVAYDSFEDAVAPIAFTVPAEVAATFLATSHGLVDDELVRVSSTGYAPGGISIHSDYYVVNKTTHTFQLASAVGGDPITITEPGRGTHYVYRDPRNYWTGFLD